jgi:hypothetical protein
MLFQTMSMMSYITAGEKAFLGHGFMHRVYVEVLLSVQNFVYSVLRNDASNQLLNAFQTKMGFSIVKNVIKYGLWA